MRFPQIFVDSFQGVGGCFGIIMMQHTFIPYFGFLKKKTETTKSSLCIVTLHCEYVISIYLEFKTDCFCKILQFFGDMAGLQDLTKRVWQCVRQIRNLEQMRPQIRASCQTQLCSLDYCSQMQLFTFLWRNSIFQALQKWLQRIKIQGSIPCIMPYNFHSNLAVQFLYFLYHFL